MNQYSPRRGHGTKEWPRKGTKIPSAAYRPQPNLITTDDTDVTDRNSDSAPIRAIRAIRGWPDPCPFAQLLTASSTNSPAWHVAAIKINSRSGAEAAEK